MFWDERGGGLIGQPLGPLAGTATKTAVMSENRVDLGENYLTMLYVPAYTDEGRPYSAALYPTSFTLASLLALTACAQRNT